MKQRVTNRLVITAVILGGWYVLCFIASLFLHTAVSDCKGTLLVGAGGLAGATCVDFNRLKQNYHESNLGAVGSGVSNYGDSYYGTGIFPQLRVQAQVCEARLQ